MEGDATPTELDALMESWGKHLEVTDKLLDHAKWLTDRCDQLAADMRVLEARIDIVNQGSGIRDNALGERLDNLDTRVTTVHTSALRALNLTTKGDPAA